MLKGLQEIGRALYYYGEPGALVQNQPLELNGISYQASPEGVLTQAAEPVPEEAAPVPEEAAPVPEEAAPEAVAP